MSVRKNLTITKAVAVHKAKRDNKNYNIILIDPNEEGQFDFGSRYEIVDDTIYHTQIKPNIVLVHTTNELIRKQNDDQTK